MKLIETLKRYCLFCKQPTFDKANLSHERYFYLQRSLIIIMFLITIVPVLITSGMSYYHYNVLLSNRAQQNMYWQSVSVRYSVEVLLENIKNSLFISVNSYPVSVLASQKELENIFLKLKDKHDGIVDMSLIGPDGIQVAYAGPYDLQGKNYKNSEWYNNTLEQMVYVSEILHGYRDKPHFVIAVCKKDEGKLANWVIRASIDSATMNSFFNSLGGSPIDDVFLVNKHGVLQTSSRYNGNIGDKVAFDLPVSIEDLQVTNEERGAADILRAVTPVQGTPWMLALEQKNYGEHENWHYFKNQLVIIIILTLSLAAITILSITPVITEKIRDADVSRESFICEQEHTNKLASIGRLAAGVAHEINNPLAIINEKAGLIKDFMQLSDDFSYRDKCLNQIVALEKAVERAKTITHRLLGFARRTDVNYTLLPINEVVEEVIEFLTKEAMHRNISIMLKLDEDLPLIRSDRGQLEQILLNITNNAIDAIDKNGTITISSQRFTADRIRLDIKDDGPGMPAEILKNIFEPFFSTKLGEGQHGTGLGLAITYGLVKKLGGEIYVESSPGAGAAFTLIFPMRGV